MAEKLECDRCGFQAIGALVPTVVTKGGAPERLPNIVNWHFVHHRQLKASVLLCHGCGALLIEWLQPPPRLAQ